MHSIIHFINFYRISYYSVKYRYIHTIFPYCIIYQILYYCTFVVVIKRWYVSYYYILGTYNLAAKTLQKIVWDNTVKFIGRELCYTMPGPFVSHHTKSTLTERFIRNKICEVLVYNEHRYWTIALTVVFSS